MPLPEFSDLNSDPRFQALPQDKKLAATNDYWNQYQAENPDASEYVDKQKANSLNYLETKAKLSDAAPVQKRILENQYAGTKLNLALTEGLNTGQINADQAKQAVVDYFNTVQPNKSAALYDPSKAPDVDKDLNDLSEAARDAAVFTSPKLASLISDEKTPEERKEIYDQIKQGVGQRYDLKPEELDDLVKHRLDVQQDPVSRDVLGQVHVKNDLLFKGPDAAKKAISDSNLPDSVKSDEINNFDKRYNDFKKSTIDNIKKNHPDFAKQYGITDVSDFDKLKPVLLNNVFTQASGGAITGVDKLISDVTHVGGLFEEKLEKPFIGPHTPFLEKKSRQMQENANRVSGLTDISNQFNKNKTSLIGINAATFGEGAVSMVEAAGIGALTGGLGEFLVPASRIEQAGALGKAALSFAKGASEATPVAGYFGAHSALDTYDQAKKAGKSEDEATSLAAVSGAINTLGFMAFGGAGHGGVAGIGSEIASNEFKEAAIKTFAQARKDFLKGTVGTALDESSKMGLINGLDTIATKAQIDPNMTVDDFKKSLYDTVVSTGIMAGLTAGGHEFRKYQETHKQSTPELQQRADALHPEENLPTIAPEPAVVTPPVDRTALEAQRDSLPPGTPERNAVEEQLSELPPVEQATDTGIPATENEQAPETPPVEQPTSDAALETEVSNEAAKLDEPQNPAEIVTKPTETVTNDTLPAETVTNEPNADTTTTPVPKPTESEGVDSTKETVPAGAKQSKQEDLKPQLDNISDKWKKEGAQLELSEETGKNPGSTKGAITLDLIRIPEEEQNKGKGSKVLDDIKQLSDKTGRPIELLPTDLTTDKSNSSLPEFYKKNGFKEYSRGKDLKGKDRPSGYRYEPNSENDKRAGVVAAKEVQPSESETKALTPEAKDLLDSIDKGGAAPAFMSKNLEKIAKYNGVEITDSMRPGDVIKALRDKQNSSKPTTPPTNETENRSQKESNSDQEKSSEEKVIEPEVSKVDEKASTPEPAKKEDKKQEPLGIRKASTSEIRKEFNLPPNETISVKDKEVFHKASEAIKENEAYQKDKSLPKPKQLVGRDLVNELLQNPRSGTEIEAALLTHEVGRANDVAKKAREKAADISDNPRIQAENEAALARARQDLDEATKVAYDTNSQAGRSLRAAQYIRQEDNSVGVLRQEAIIKNKGPLNENQSKEIEILADKYAKNLKERDEEIARLKEEAAQNLEDAHIEHIEREAKMKPRKSKNPEKERIKQEKAKQDKERDADLDKQIAEAKKRRAARKGNLNAGIDPSDIYDVGVIMTAHIRKGIRNIADFTKALVKEFGEKFRPHAKEIYDQSRKILKAPKSPEELLALVDKNKDIPERLIYNMVKGYSDRGESDPVSKTHEAIQKVWPGTTREMVRDAFTGYGNKIAPPKSELVKRLVEHKRFETLSAQLADLKAGVEPKTEKAKQEKSNRVTALEKEVKALRPKAEKKVAVRDALKAVKTRFQNETKVYDKAVADHESIPAKSRGVEYDAEATRLKERRDESKAAYDKIFSDPNLKENQKIKQAIKLLDKQIAEEDRLQKEGILKNTSTKKDSSLFSPEISDRQNELAQKRQLREDAYNALHPKKTAEQRAFENATKSVKESIANYEEILKTGTIPEKEERASKFTPTQELGVLWDTRNRLKTAVNELRKSQFPRQSKEEITRKRALAAAEKTIKDLTNRIETKDFSKNTTLKSTDPDVVAARALRDSLRKTYNELEKASKVTKTPEQIKEERRFKAAQKRNAALKERIDTGNFTKEVKPESVTSPRIQALNYEKAKLDAEYQKKLSEFALNKASPLYKGVRVVKASTQFRKLIKLGLDFALGRQGIISLARAPLRTLYQMGRAIKNIKEADAFKIYEGLQDPAQRPFAKYTNDIKSFKLFSPIEEGFANKEDILDFEVLDKLEKIPHVGKLASLVKGVERVNRTMHNLLATDTFDAIAKANADENGNITKDTAALASNAAMKAVGRGDFKNPELDKGVKLANTVLLSTRYYLARALYLAGSPIYTNRAGFKGTAKARATVAYQLYGRVMFNTAAAMYGASLFMDEKQKKEFLDPRSSNFGIITYNGQKHEILTSIRPFINVIARSITGEKVKDGKVIPLRGEGSNSYKGDLKSEWKSFVENRMNINTRFLYDTVGGSFFGGEPITLKSTLSELMLNLNAKTDWDLAFNDKVPVGQKLLDAALVEAGFNVDPVNPPKVKTTKSTSSPYKPPRYHAPKLH